MKLHRRAASLLAACAGLASVTSAQVVINEVYENPEGSGTIDQIWEFIELYGAPGLRLDGYAIALIKGGADINGDNIAESPPEIDEAYSLDGLAIPEGGLLTLVNANNTGFSAVGNRFLTPNPAYLPFLPDSVQNRRWLDGVSLPALHIPADDAPGNLANDFSSTYVLVRKRPFHSLNAQGQSVYAPGYSWKKDIVPDINFDSDLDFGAPLPGRALQPYQMVDDLAWSNAGGKEYVRSSQNEISDTPGFNPDAIARLRYFVTNPALGHRTRDLDAGAFEILPTRIADESFIYGEVRNLNTLAFFDGVDKDGFYQIKAPTDPNGPLYDGTCDPEPDDVPNPPACSGAPSGEFRFDDLDVAGFTLTPNGFNDHPTNSQLRQFRFVTGDFNFDGVVTQADRALLESRLGASLDDQVPATYDNNTPDDPSDDFAYTEWAWQGAAFQQVLMMLRMDLADGENGQNAPVVTPSDLAALLALLPCEGDTNGDGVINFSDLNTVLSSFGSTGAGQPGDVNGDGVVNFSDLNTVLSRFGESCD